MKIPLTRDVLVIKGNSSFILVGIVAGAFALCLETDKDEISQGIESGDLVVVSAPECGEILQGLILLELVRTYHVPVMVLPKGHPGSSRLRMIVSTGTRICMNCSIQRGTHPEQHLLCSSDELSGMTLEGYKDGVLLSSCPSHCTFHLIDDPILQMNRFQTREFYPVT